MDEGVLEDEAALADDKRPLARRARNQKLDLIAFWGLDSKMVSVASGGMKSVAVKVSPSGRLHLPSEVRKALGLKGAGHLVITITDGQATLTTMAENLARIRALARPYVPKGQLASDELIAERREEAAAEQQTDGADRRRGAGRRAQG
jgi:bifunctional DNA-binding transcriptional regulator/antitoxin component of YhaV-PrlF toxin-antitoxin module